MYAVIHLALNTEIHSFHRGNQAVSSRLNSLIEMPTITTNHDVALSSQLCFQKTCQSSTAYFIESYPTN